MSEAINHAKLAMLFCREFQLCNVQKGETIVLLSDLGARLPVIVSELDESRPCTHNPLGAKGCGEAGAIGAPTAIVSAVLEALRPLGVTDIQLPLAPERVSQAIYKAKNNA
jgi:hypothetical protein